jgi:hypothetical protein
MTSTFDRETFSEWFFTSGKSRGENARPYGKAESIDPKARGCIQASGQVKVFKHGSFP